MNIGIDIGGVILTKAGRGVKPREIDGAFDSVKS